jgi:putative transposase
MPRKHTASFILELPLKTDPGAERACAVTLDAGRNIGNAVLGEGLRRLDLMRLTAREKTHVLLRCRENRY